MRQVDRRGPGHANEPVTRPVLAEIANPIGRHGVRVSSALTTGEHDAPVLRCLLEGSGGNVGAGHEQNITLPVGSNGSLCRIAHGRLLRCLGSFSSDAFLRRPQPSITALRTPWAGPVFDTGYERPGG